MVHLISIGCVPDRSGERQYWRPSHDARVQRGLADAAGLQALRLDQAPPEDSGGVTNAWTWLAPNGTPAPDGADVTDPTQAAPVLWTDDFSNLIGVLR